MSGTGPYTIIERPGSDPVAAMLGTLRAALPRPAGPDLLRAALSGLTTVPEVRRVLVALNPDRQGLVDGRPPTGPWCRFKFAGVEPNWLEVAGGWGTLRAAMSDTGDWTAFWRHITGEFDDGATGLHWAGDVVRIGDSEVVAVVVAADRSTMAEPAWKASYVNLVSGLEVMVAMLADAQSSRSELEQVSVEVGAVSRLNRLQGRFVAMASHEFKAPLTSITAYADVLRTQISDDDFPHAGEFLDVIRSEANRLLRMVNRILDFTRLEYGSQLMACEPVDLEELVQEAVRALAATTAEKKLQVEIDAPLALPRAEVDPDLIRQVLINLLGNAIKFTPAGGRIDITLSEEESAVAVSVRDSGPGIPAEDIRRIFREFYRSDAASEDPDGTGLGLSIAKHIVQLHGGHIDVQRRPEGGSDFRFLVPKKTDAFVTLGHVLGQFDNPDNASRLVGTLMRMVAELTGSRAVALLMRDGQGALIPVGAMGLAVDPSKIRPVIETGAWTQFLTRGRAELNPGAIVGDLNLGSDGEMDERMYCPLGNGEDVCGLLVAGRRSDAGHYLGADLAQLGVLAEVVRNALDVDSSDVAKTCDALQVLLQIRRTGVPTSTPEALDLTSRLARRLDLSDRDTRRLLYAATLHDAGMARVEDEIVLGASPLSWDERDEIDRHVDQGVELLAPLAPDPAVKMIIRHHHERWDGSGHPKGLAGTEIPLGSRVLGVVDAWFSLTQDRPYRQGLPAAEALDEIVVNAGMQFDPAVVTEFCEVLIESRIVSRPVVEPGPSGAGH